MPLFSQHQALNFFSSTDNNQRLATHLTPTAPVIFRSAGLYHHIHHLPGPGRHRSPEQQHPAGQ